MASLEDISLLNPDNIAVTKEHLKTCCKPVYHPRRLKSKGALLILVWNFLCMSVFFHWSLYIGNKNISKAWLATLVGITLLIAGWLADTRIGRYKVVRTSIWIMWIAAVIATISSTSAYFSQSYHGINNTVLNVTMFIMAVGLGGFVINIIQFGLDQLQDASTIEIKSFIVWHVWTINCQGILMKFIFACTREKYGIFRLLFVCANLSLAMVLLFTCNHCLIKEPIQQNPLELVYKVNQVCHQKQVSKTEECLHLL